MKNFIKICVLLASLAIVCSASGTDFNVWSMETFVNVLESSENDKVSVVGMKDKYVTEWLKDGDKIRLRWNLELTKSIRITKKISLDSFQKAGSDEPTLPHLLSRGNSRYNITITSTGGLTVLGDTILDGGNLAGVNPFIVVETGGALVLEAGSVVQNCQRGNGDGVAVRVEGGTVTMNGGTIRDCKTDGGWSGGAVLISSGSMTMNGGTITGCEAGHEGGAIVVGAWGTANDARLYLRGGTITGNKTCTTRSYSSAGGAVCALIETARIYVSGDPVVDGNTQGTRANNIAFFQSGWESHLIQDGPLAADARLGVSSPTTGSAAADAAGKRFAVVEGGDFAGAQQFFWDGNATEVTAVRKGSTLYWKPLNAVYDGTKTFAEILAASNAALDPLVIEIPNSTSADSLVIPAGREVVIDLMGSTLTANIVANGSLTITDSNPARTGKLVGSLAQGDAGHITLEWGTYTVAPDAAWLADNRIVLENDGDTYLVTQRVGESSVVDGSLDTRRGVRVVDNPSTDVLPLTYASMDWVYGASKDATKSACVTVAAALPATDGDFANAQWHDGLAAATVAPGDNSYDYPSGNKNIRAIAGAATLYNGPGEDEVVWREARTGLVEAVLTTSTGTLRAWYKFPEAIIDIVPVLPGDPAKVKEPGTDGTAMNTPGNKDYPGYTVTNDPTHPWGVVEDPFNPGNYVAETPAVADPANTAMQVTLQVVGPGTLTWKDLILDGSGENDSTMTVSIDGGAPIPVHTGGMDTWANQRVDFGGDVDTRHTVVITFKGNTSGNAADQAHGYVDGVIWTPETPAAKADVKATDSEDFTFANLGSEPTAERKGETFFYPNGAETGMVLDTTSTVDANGKQLTSTVGGVTETSTGTEDYWYAVKDNVSGNTIAQTAPTLSPGEATTMVVTDLSGPVKVSWDMMIDDPSTAKDSKLQVVVTKRERDAQGHPVLDPATGEPVVTTTTRTYTAAQIAAWTDGYLSLGGPSDYTGNGQYTSAATYDVAFTFVNNSDGTAVGKLDNIKVVHPDLNVAPEVNDGANHASAGSKYTGEVNDPKDVHYPNYTVSNDRLNPWEVVDDPSNANDKVAQTPDSLAPGESTTLTFTVQGDGEFRWSNLIDSGNPEASGKAPAKITVIVDGTVNEILTTDLTWTDHVVHVVDATGNDGGTHTIQIVFTNDGDTGDATAYIDNVTWTPSATPPEMYQIVQTDPASETEDELMQRITIVNGPESGWMPVYKKDADGNIVTDAEGHPVVEAVRSPDGTEGTNPRTGEGGASVPGDQLESKFTLGVTGTGEIKVGYIEIPVKTTDTKKDADGNVVTDADGNPVLVVVPGEGNSDAGALTITVDGKVYEIPPVPDETVSYSIRTENGKIIIENLVIKVDESGTTTGTGDTPLTNHEIVFTYTRDADDPTGNTVSVIKDITWKTYGETDNGGSSWLQSPDLWIVDHEPLTEGKVYLAFNPTLKVPEEIEAWLDRTVRNDKLMVKYSATREGLATAKLVFAKLSTKHTVSSEKVWVSVELKDIVPVEDADEQVTDLVDPVGYWRIYIAASTSPAARRMAKAMALADGETGVAPTENQAPIAETSAESVNTFGILKIESTAKSTMIAVPWTWYSKEEAKAADIPVKKLVKTTNLTEGDMLYLYAEDMTYKCWGLVDGEWRATTTVTVDAEGVGTMHLNADDDEGDAAFAASTRIPRGSGLWLVRRNPFTVSDNGDGTVSTNAVPFWVYGQSVATPVDSVVAPLSASTDESKTTTGMSTIVGNPYAQAVAINDLVFEGDIHEKDEIVIPQPGGALLRCHYTASEPAGERWWYTTTAYRKIGSRLLPYSKVMTDASVPAGLAFWYVRRGDGELKIRWTPPVAPAVSE